jgi:hypothetical protein
MIKKTAKKRTTMGRWRMWIGLVMVATSLGLYKNKKQIKRNMMMMMVVIRRRSKTTTMIKKKI